MRVTVHRDSLPGVESLYYVEDDELIIELGSDLDDVAQQRVIHEAMQEHGVETKQHRRRLLALPLFVGAADSVRNTVKTHPGPTAVILTGALAAAAVGAMIVTQLGPEHERGRPPAAAAPSASRTPQKTEDPVQTHSPATSSTPRPDGKRPETRPMESFKPTAYIPSPRPPRPPEREPTPTPPRTPTPNPSPPPVSPSTDPRRCLLQLEVPPLLGLRLLCDR